MNTYTITNRKSSHEIDRTKRNVLIIGKAASNNKLKTIINPLTTNQAYKLYGSSRLYEAYRTARNISNDTNIYTVNCEVFTDFIEIIDDIIHYDFDFIVPIDINFRDTFINPTTNKTVYFSSYYLEKLGKTKNKTILIMSDRESYLYEDIDSYLSDMRNIYSDYINNNNDIVNNYGNNLVFVLNNFTSNKYSNVVLAASLSVCDFDSYPKNVSYKTYFDIDYSDFNYTNSICFYKYHPTADYSSVEQLYNFRPLKDAYQKVLIDLVVKYVVSKLDLNEFSGSLYTPYIRVKIDIKIKSIMEEMQGVVFKSFSINNISFKKTDIGVGYLIVDISIVPHSLLEKINIFMEV